MDLPPTDSPELTNTFITRVIQDRNYRMAERITGLLALLEPGYLVTPVE